MTFNEMEEALREAQRVQSTADRHVNTMVRLISGRLQTGHVSGYTLCKLKRELSKFNAHTKQWKN